MNKYYTRPDITPYVGIEVTKETELTYETEKVKQTIKDLVLHSITTIENEEYKSTYDTIIYLKEGDRLIFEEDGRGYIKPVEQLVTIEEAIDDFNNIK